MRIGCRFCAYKVLEVRTDCPPARRRWMTREAEAEGDGGMSAISGDRDGRRKCHTAPAGADRHAADLADAGRLAHDRAADGDAWIELASGRDRLLQQQPIEIAAQNGAPPLPRRVTPLDGNAALAGDHHPVDAQTARLDLLGEAERAQPRERARIDRVAA